MTIKLIIGLRNPGSEYEHTRHNAGGWCVMAVIRHYNLQLKLEKKMYAELASLKQLNHSCFIALPTTFMNHSGQPARALCQFYQIPPEEVLVIHDELDLTVGRVKLKKGGGHGGHNGLKDLITQLGSNTFYRLRIGIGHPGHRDLVHQYVLSKPSVHDKKMIEDAIDRSTTVMPLVLSGDIALAMNQLNAS
jgi:peptidyl-tRNA hydrolase, PTH1 family